VHRITAWLLALAFMCLISLRQPVPVSEQQQDISPPGFLIGKLLLLLRSGFDEINMVGYTAWFFVMLSEQLRLAHPLRDDRRVGAGLSLHGTAQSHFAVGCPSNGLAH
jgi:hypothetical protein